MCGVRIKTRLIFPLSLHHHYYSISTENLKKTNKQTTKYKVAKYYGGIRHFECRIILYRNDT